MSEEKVLIEVKDLHVNAGAQVLVDGANFKLFRGEHKVVIGPNGAGKTSLLRAVLGSLVATSGSVFLSGKDLSVMSRGEIARTLAYVPQLLAVEVPYTVREFVGMGRYAHGGNSSDDAVDEAMEVVGVSQFQSRVVSTLSGGERQRVCISAALAQAAPILILDEPLVHLDPSQRMEVQKVLRSLPEEVTVMVVTHDIDWARSDFQSLLAMKGGRVNYDGASDDFFNHGGIDELFGKEVAAKYGKGDR